VRWLGRGRGVGGGEGERRWWGMCVLERRGVLWVKGQVWMVLRASAFGVGSEIEIGIGLGLGLRLGWSGAGSGAGFCM
jgi:hypothetical protein